jgi:ribonuclease R
MLDPAQHALVDRASGRAWRVGDEMHVEVVSVSLSRRRIELAPVSAAGDVRARPAPGEWPEPRRKERPEHRAGGQAGRGRGLAEAIAERRDGRGKAGHPERGPRPGEKAQGGGKGQRSGQGAPRSGSGHSEKGRDAKPGKKGQGRRGRRGR